MAMRARLTVLTDPALHARVAANAAGLVRTTYCTTRIVPFYEAAYRRVLDRSGSSSS